MNPSELIPIAIIIPAYCCQKQIADVIASIPAHAGPGTAICHIIVVDDGSTDETARVVEGCLESEPRLGLIRHEHNQGVGAAVLSGYAEAARRGAKVLVKIDGDGQMDPAFIPTLISPILSEKADYTKGNRFLHSRELKSMPFVRRLGNIGLSFLAKAASGYWNVFDPTNGYTAIRAGLVPHLSQENIDSRYFFEISLLSELGLQRAVVKDVYIPARYRSERSSLSELDSLVRFPLKLVRAFFRRILIQYFVRDFNAVSLLMVSGLSGCLFGSLWGGYYWIRSIETGVLTTTGTVMIAVLPLILGLQSLLQALVLDVQAVPKEPGQDLA